MVFMIVGLVILVLLGVVSTGWALGKVTELISSIGVFGLVVIGIGLYFILKRYTPFGAVIDLIGLKVLSAAQQLRQGTLLTVAVVVALVFGLSYFGALGLIPGFNNCTTETIDYNGHIFDIKGCPLGQNNRYEETLAAGAAYEMDQGYTIQADKLRIHSKSISRGKNLGLIQISGETKVEKDTEFTLYYDLYTTYEGRAANVYVFEGLTNKKFEVKRGPFIVVQAPDLVDIMGSPSNDPWRMRYEAGELTCSTTTPSGARYSSPHCWVPNKVTSGQQQFTISAGKTMRVVIETDTGGPNGEQAEVVVQLQTAKIASQQSEGSQDSVSINQPVEITDGFWASLRALLQRILSYF